MGHELPGGGQNHTSRPNRKEAQSDSRHGQQPRGYPLHFEARGGQPHHNGQPYWNANHDGDVGGRGGRNDGGSGGRGRGGRGGRGRSAGGRGNRNGSPPWFGGVPHQERVHDLGHTSTSSREGRDRDREAERGRGWAKEHAHARERQRAQGEEQEQEQEQEQERAWRREEQERGRAQQRQLARRFVHEEDARRQGRQRERGEANTLSEREWGAGSGAPTTAAVCWLLAPSHARVPCYTRANSVT